jgi:pentatricopeptide repeat protein
MNQVGKHQHQHQYGTIGKVTQIAQISEPTRCPSTSSALYSTVAPTSTSTVNQNNTANGKPQKAPHPYNKRHKSFTINEKVRHITNRLLYKKDKRYWDEHLTEDQMDKAKYAIQAWSQVTSSPSASQKGAENIERILKRLEREKQNGNPNIELTLVLYNLVIDVWAKSELPERAEAVLRQMQSMKNLYPNCIKSNNLPYNTVIHSWKRSGEGERAENILKMMRETNVEPDVISYNGVVLAYARNYHKYGYADHGHRVLEEMEQTNLTMDSFLYNAVMDAHAKSRGHESAKRAESLLIKMEEYGDDHKAQPNTISYTTVIDAYAKMQSNDSCVNAERIFRKMEAAHSAGNVNARPNNRSFNAVINAYVQTKNPGSALRAEEILMKMIDLSKSGYVDAKPNVVSFTTG